MGIFKDLTGQQFNRWTVVNFSHKSQYKESIWFCKCLCGTERLVKGAALINGRSTSCGCYHKELMKLIIEEKINKKSRLPAGEASFNMLLRIYKKNAKKKNRIFSLSVEDFGRLTKDNCHYCGDKPYRISFGEGTNGAYVYNGVDRIDNEIGYIVTNCVTCCYNCNELKGSSTYQEFIEKIHKISKYRRNNEKNSQGKGIKSTADGAQGDRET